MGKTAADVMTADPQSVAQSATAAEAARLMREQDVGSLPVVSSNRVVVGVVTDRDLVVRVIAEGLDPATTPVTKVATDPPVTVEASTDLDEALELMAKHQVRRLPVVEGDQLVGVIAQADVARLGKDKRTGELVEELSQP
jgi:CBS domain-containing protein